MSQALPFSCFLIGADSLLIECGEILLRCGHEVRGVLTSDQRVRAWARSKNLPALDAESTDASELRRSPFDYLFSIGHLSLIPESILQLPVKGAINFHDGPLPRYAGLNTPAWALIRGETEYGITWHRIEGGVDEGPILAQRLFAISPGETSLSLNTRCFEAGLETFAELVDPLAAGTAHARPQDLSQRAYFGRHDRPAAAAVLDWTQPAADLDALVRALDFGRYPNPLGSAKIAHDQATLTVTRCEMTAGEGRPGTLLSADAGGITVAAADGALRLTGFCTLAGTALSPEQALSQLGLSSGEALRGPDAAACARLTQLEAQFCRSEGSWTRRLLRLDAPTLPWSAPAMPEAGTRHARLEIALPAPLSALDDAERVAAIIGAYGQVLARLCGRQELTLGLGHEALSVALQGTLPIYSSRALLSLPVQPEPDFAALRAAVRVELERSRKAGSWPHDLFMRQPGLHGRPRPFAAGGLDLTIELRRDPQTFQPGAHDLLVLVVSTDGKHAYLNFDRSRLAPAAARVMQSALEVLLQNLTAHPQLPVGQLDLLPAPELRKIVEVWNATATPIPAGVCIHDLIEQQAQRTPKRTAVVFEDQELSYAELMRRSGLLATRLSAQGAGPGSLVGVHLERSLDLVVAVLGVLRAGAAYVPLDPAFPVDRLAFMIEDAHLQLIVSQRDLRAQLQLPTGAKVVEVDAPMDAEASPTATPHRAQPADLAYVIYTSGSTGRPKGVMVEHRNVINFFAGMDARIPHEPPGKWLAVTSLSFDISVLELLWTLARGFEVVVYRDRDRGRAAGPAAAKVTQPMDFGLYLWGSDAGPGARKYELMLEAARFGDTHGFSSVWTPERHFHAFGGPYPNPSVTSAAIAAVTERIQIRAGSCVSPLHHPIRIAEEWAVVDNLSNGRVGISFASGWQPDDFVLRPENFADNKNQMMRDVETVRKLWRGDSVDFPGPKGEPIGRVTLPRPVQPELPVWITSAGNPETYRMAGAAGANVLTHLLGQNVKEVKDKIRIYREARAAAGLDPAGGIVTLMLHTFIGDDLDTIRDTVREPMKRYLASATNLVKKYAWSFPAFKRPDAPKASLDDIDLDALSAEDMDAMMEHAFQRYFETSGLFGTPESVQPMIEELKAIGVNEIGCLIDYSLPNELTLKHLEHLDRARRLANPQAASSGQSLQEQVRRRRVSHLQCTPSMARMLLLDVENRGTFGSLEQLMIGGEAFPPALARELDAAAAARITNMYGPTETTVWSSTHEVDPRASSIPIGKPIANTQLYVLDAHRRPLPVGVPGDLYIGGAGVVRGYHERPELTAERFLPNPFRPGERMYATGDVARWREDGVVEFLGRSDHQVKIRGYRIELGEIEALLGEQEGVREGVVAVSLDAAGEPRLVAYLTANGAVPDPAALRESLRARLPEYMVPAHFIVLDELPLTPNAKVDRKALPAPESLRTTARPAPAAEAAPQGELQGKIAACWRQVLGVEQVGAQDNFFDIGGHSLLVVRLQRMLKDALERPLALTDLYRFPTIQGLAHWLESDGEDANLAKSADRAEQRRAAAHKRRLRDTLE